MVFNWLKACLRVSSHDCSKGKSLGECLWQVSLWCEAEVDGPGTALPVSVVLNFPCPSLQQVLSTNIFLFNVWNPGWFVPRITGWVTNCCLKSICPQNLIMTDATGYPCILPCTHLIFTNCTVPNASPWTRIWWTEIWLQPDSTNAWYVTPEYSLVYGMYQFY